MTSDDNQTALAAHQLRGMPERELLWLVRALLRQMATVTADEYRSQLAVCAEYAADARCSRVDCFRLHLCPRLAAGECRAGAGCRWSHQLTDPENVMVLLRLRCAELSEAEVLALLARRPDNDDSSSDSSVFQANGIGSRHDSGKHGSATSSHEGDASRSSPDVVSSSPPGTCRVVPNATENSTSKNHTDAALKMNLCRYNIFPSRCAGDCGKLHLCRFFVADMCPFGKKCTSSHNLCSTHNVSVLKERGLEGASEEELVNAIKAGYLARNPISDVERRFALQICRPFQKKGKCYEKDCLRLHVCAGYVTGTCANGSECGLSHQLSTSANAAIIKRVGLIHLRHNELLEMFGAPLAAKDVWQSMFSGSGSAVSSGSSSLPVESRQATPEVSGNGSTTEVRDLTSDVNICHYNINPSRCEGDCGKLHLCRLFLADMCPFAEKCKSGHKLLSSPHNIGVLKQLGFEHLSEGELLSAIKAGYLTRTPITDLERRFALQKCHAYLRAEDVCEDENCLRLHVCDGYVDGTCANGSGCGRSHQLTTGTNAANIKRVGLKHLPHKELLEVLRTLPTAKDVLKELVPIEASGASSVESAPAPDPSQGAQAASPSTHDTGDGPTLCAVHASGGHCQRADCDGFHICGFFLANLCRRPDNLCPLGHSFDDEHNQWVLEQRGLRGGSPEHFQELIDQMTQQAHITFPNEAEGSVRMCVPYNSKSGCTVQCGRFHVCHRYLAGTCSETRSCPLRHAFDGSHNQHLLNTLGLLATLGRDGTVTRVTDRELTELLRARIGASPGVYETLPEWARPTGGSSTAAGAGA